MNNRTIGLIILITFFGTNTASALAQGAGQGKPFETQIQIHSKGPTGPYNIRASVESTQPSKPTALMHKIPQAEMPKSGMSDKSKGLTEEQRKQLFKDFLSRYFTGQASSDLPMGDPLTTGFINEAVDMATEQNDRNLQQQQQQQQQQTQPTRPNRQQNQTANDESHHHASPSSNPEAHHHLPTDGSPNSEAITTQAIETFYGGLPPDITNRVAGLGIDPLATVHGAGDPYAPYAMALQRGDFARMREIANSEAINDWNQRIAMLGLAGATALRNMANPNNPKAFAAKESLRKVAEDLHYAGQGLGTDNPNDAKLKATCEDISRIWSNMTNQGQTPAGQ